MPTDEEIIAADLADKRNKDSQRDLGNEFTYLLVLRRRKMPVVERHVVIKQRDTSADTIWGVGIWGTDSWDSSYTNSFQTTRVINQNREYIDNLRSTLFKDTSGTATWTGGGSISFTSGQQAISLPIYLNNETLSSATITASDSGSFAYMLSADGGANYETATKGTAHTFTNQGTDLRFKISASSTGSVSQIKVTY